MLQLTKQQLFIGILSVVVLIVLIIGFTMVGTPVSQRAVSLDNQRLSNFNNIKYSIESNYETTGLPLSLSELKTRVVNSGYSAEVLSDPETKQSIGYEVASVYSFRLCTTFSTDTESTNQSGAPAYYDTSNIYYPNNTQHSKGYDCITYEISEYLRTTPTPTPYPYVYPTLYYPTPGIGTYCYDAFDCQQVTCDSGTRDATCIDNACQCGSVTGGPERVN